jgi:hypothetical protein
MNVQPHLQMDNATFLNWVQEASWRRPSSRRVLRRVRSVLVAAVIAVPALGVDLPLAAIYAGVEF